MIEFVCVDPKHRLPAEAEEVNSPLTIHDGTWAYCPSGLCSDHVWRPIEAIALADLRRRSKELIR
ncbi:MAG: hypothetical protein ABJB39_02125 [Chloroflexota bacterium]